MKKCTVCKILKDNSEFGRNNKRAKCTPCNKVYNNRWYRDNIEERKPQLRKNVKASLARIRSNILDYLKSHPCLDCGESNPVVLDFDHIGLKTYSVSHMVQRRFTWKTILKEMNECEIRCSNCHRKMTAIRNPNHWIHKQ